MLQIDDVDYQQQQQQQQRAASSAQSSAALQMITVKTDRHRIMGMASTTSS